tara:strand:+ start:1240 stop:1410 length:171 start_codon:yes stop_codon:yes gene_type:complete
MFGTSHTVKKTISSKAVGLICGSKGDMSRRFRGKKKGQEKELIYWQFISTLRQTFK